MVKSGLEMLVLITASVEEFDHASEAHGASECRPWCNGQVATVREATESLLVLVPGHR